MKQVIVVRTDLEMSPGKLAAQAAHASVSALITSPKKMATRWLSEGQTKIVVQVESAQALRALEDKCDKKKIISAIIADAGRTELKPGTLTALAVGPDEDDKIDSITGALPLLK